MGTCALRGGRSATNATNPGVEVESSTLQGAGVATPGAVEGVAGSFLSPITRSVPLSHDSYHTCAVDMKYYQSKSKAIVAV